MMRCIDPEQANHLLREDDLLLLDMRDAHAYRQAHMQGAMNLGDHNLKALLKQTDKTRPVLIYCYHGISSQDMARMFSDFGFEHVYSLDGGYAAWQSYRSGIDRVLLEAAATDHTDEALRALRAGADPSCQDTVGNSALCHAARQGNLALAQALMDAGADPNHQNHEGFSALMRALGSGHAGLAQLLLETGANPRLTTLEGLTALDMTPFPQFLTLPTSASGSTVPEAPALETSCHD